MKNGKILVACWNYYEELSTNNYMFQTPNIALGENLLSPLSKLYEKGLENGIEFVTLDTVTNYEQVDLCLFFDLPDHRNPLVQMALKSWQPIYLIIGETPMIKPDNYDPNNTQFFKKIYTWLDDAVDGKNVIKYHIPQDLPEKIEAEFNSRKLCTLIASNKMVGHPQELYSARLQFLQWFEGTVPDEFDFYGYGWESNTHPVYRGTTDSKIATLQKYKFAICFENSQGYNGYVTEKIFDCLKAGTIPIYWGAPNIVEYVPNDCFIDLRNFKTIEEVYAHIKAIDEKMYQEYITNINKFLQSDKAKLFSSDYYADNFIKDVLDEVKDTPIQPEYVVANIPEYNCQSFENNLVSVIIPTYNRNWFLERAIKSVLNQTFQNFEIIVVNDCGDPVESVTDSFHDGRIKVINHTENKKVSASRNTGIKASKGRYICFLDSDDFFYKDHLRVAVDCLDHSQAGVVYTDCMRITEQKDFGDAYKITGKDLVYSIEWDKNLLLVQNITPITGVVIDKSLLNETGLFDESISVYEDWDLLIRLSRWTSFIHIPKITCAYSWRPDGSSMSTSWNKEFGTLMPTIFKRYDFLTNDEIQVKQNILLKQRNVRRIP